LRTRRKLAENKKQLDKRKQSIRVLVFPRKKYARLVFVPVRAELRQNTVHKVFANKSRYDDKRRETDTRKAVALTSGGVFSPRYIEMTVLKEDVDQRSQDVLDIIFELEGRRRRAELE